eukprot:CAMPEP_0167799890 /NCGR_PEP_ID=MMETSP0111_2-20121227/17366_1 /TAXON_ID=91324 /ORGANISM="Lotharella globosa, Strain CCCM811" /LENGTH=142 /DNA_ID=CAMNT_0007694967 /DNA_START=40 /DNA_END=465 /DNA_ORIENTATION=+
MTQRHTLLCATTSGWILLTLTPLLALSASTPGTTGGSRLHGYRPTISRNLQRLSFGNTKAASFSAEKRFGTQNSYFFARGRSRRCRGGRGRVGSEGARIERFPDGTVLYRFEEDNTEGTPSQGTPPSEGGTVKSRGGTAVAE